MVVVCTEGGWCSCEVEGADACAGANAGAGAHGERFGMGFGMNLPPQ